MLAQESQIDTAQSERLLAKGMDSYYQIKYDSALIYFRASSDHFIESKSWERYIHCLNLIADTYSRRLLLDSMDANLKKARLLESHYLEEDNLECALTYSLIGLLHIYREQFDSAVSEIEVGKSIREKKLGKDHRAVAASCYLLGLAYCDGGKYDEALRWATEALRIHRILQDDDHFDHANTLILCGGIYARLGNCARALEYFLQGLGLINNGDQKYEELSACCEFNIGWAYNDLGKYSESIEHLKRAISGYRKVHGERNAYIGSSYLELGEVMIALGDYERATDYLYRSLSMGKDFAGDKHSLLANIGGEIADAYAHNNRLEDAFKTANGAILMHLNRLGSNHPTLSYLLEIRGNIYRRRGMFHQALTDYKRAMSLRPKLSDSTGSYDVSRLYSEIGTVFVRMKRFDSASIYYHKSLDLNSRLPISNRCQRAEALAGLGHVCVEKRSFPEAFQYFQQALVCICPDFQDSSIYSNPTLATTVNGKELVDILAEKARAFERRYAVSTHKRSDLEAALSTYKCTAIAIDLLRKKYYSDASKLSLGEQSYSLYQDAVKVSVKLFNATREQSFRDAAFWFAEHSKANVLFDGILDSEAKRFGGIPDSLLELERDLRITLEHYETALQKELEKKEDADTAKILSLQDARFTVNNRREELLKIAEKDYPKYYDLKYTRQSTSLEEVQAELDKNSCIIEYCIGKHQLFIFLISNSFCDIKTVPLPADFARRISTFNNSVRTVDEQKYLTTGAQLYDVLIRPLRSKLSGKNRLVIIPDGVLHSVPFETLIEDIPHDYGKPINFSTLKYLVRSFEISYSYSASFYLDRLQDEQRESRDAQSFVGFAPVFSDGERNNHVLTTSLRSFAHDSSALRVVVINNQQFGELKYSEKEVNLIAEYFQQAGKLSRSFVRKSASEDNFKLNAGKYSYIHIATHGLINDEHPELSMLLFSQPPDTLGPEDGILFAGETYDLNLRAELITLSCCECGRGKYIKGEGMMAMARGFFYSGAENVMFSLWKVYDREANDLMLDFYRRVLGGETFSSSLREAKLIMISKEETAFPLNWGGFVLIGR